MEQILQPNHLYVGRQIKKKRKNKKKQETKNPNPNPNPGQSNQQWLYIKLPPNFSKHPWYF